jgi:short-subunit dehydrogenase
MKLAAGQTVLLTGATGGLGPHMAAALASRGMNLVLVAYPGGELEEVRLATLARGVKAISLVLDLAKDQDRRQAIEATKTEFGGVDLLVNNAGVEYSSYYHELSETRIKEVLSVNLEAPMMMSWLALPGMLNQGHGHIVNISSLAAKSGPAFQECYAATKAALFGFTMSLRATYRRLGVSASVICPGFVEAGIYSRLKTRAGRSAPALLGAVSPERVARALLRAVESDRLEIIVNRYPVRPLLALSAVSPSLGCWLAAQFGVNDFFQRVVDAEKRASAPRDGTPPTG